jgi:predicted ester cyclase
VAAGDAVVRSSADLIRFLRGEYATFPDAHEELVATFSDGTMVSARHRFRGTQRGPLGTHPPTGRQMTAEYLAIYRIQDGRIAEAWAEWDNLAGLRQLGLLPGAARRGHEAPQ